MIPIRLAIHRIRHAIHDEQHVNYSDHEILDVINAGVRLIRRTIADIQPEILMSEATGILQEGEDTIKLKKRPLMIIEMTAGNKIISFVEGYSNRKIYHNREKIFGNQTKIYSKYELKSFAEHLLKETNLQHLKNYRNCHCHDGHHIFCERHPIGFYRVGLQSVKVFPKPQSETAWTIRTIDDFEELHFEDSTPLINDFDDFLLEYAFMRLSIDNNYDMTQEQQIVANIHAQISQVLSPPPVSAQVRGYW